jgi:hypothetical protein
MEIRFKATRRIHDSGYALLEKEGALEYDQDPPSRDGIWLYPKNGGRIFIDCDYKTKIFRIVFDEKDFKKNSNPPQQNT